MKRSTVSSAVAAILLERKPRLRRNEDSLVDCEGFRHARRQECLDWVTEAKREATRAKPLASAIEWLAERQPRNWQPVRGWHWA